jgi:hypothetical protein
LALGFAGLDLVVEGGAGEGVGVGLLDLSRSVITICDGGDFDDAWGATTVESMGAKIDSVLSIHLRVVLEAGKEGRPPLRFFVAFSNCPELQKEWYRT